MSTTTVHRLVGAAPGSAAAQAMEGRAGILAQTQAAEEAVLRPNEPGAWPHDLRAALAARIARLNGEEALAAHFLADAGARAGLADMAETGADQGPETGAEADAVLAAALAFMDKVATCPREAAASDIVALQQAGISDADIVRLAELNAFLAYQIRVIRGLRLLAGGAA